MYRQRHGEACGAIDIDITTVDGGEEKGEISKKYNKTSSRYCQKINSSANHFQAPRIEGRNSLKRVIRYSTQQLPH